MSYQNLCGEAGSNILLDCNNIPVNGTSDRLLLINRNDIDTAATTIAADGSISSLALKATKTAFQIDGIAGSINPDEEQVIQGGIPRYRHRVAFRPFKVDQATRNEIEKYAKGNCVAVLETLDNTYEIYGYNVGMKALLVTRNPNDAETNGNYVVTMASDDQRPLEPKLPRIYLNTDYATTTTELEALIAP